MYIFSIILVVIMSEDPSSTKTKVIWSIIGMLGTFFIGIIRLVTIFVGFYFYGYEQGQIIHSYIGYILFILWSLIFLYLFSKRNTISQKIRRSMQKLRAVNITFSLHRQLRQNAGGDECNRKIA